MYIIFPGSSLVRHSLASVGPLLFLSLDGYLAAHWRYLMSISMLSALALRQSRRVESNFGPAHTSERFGVINLLTRFLTYESSGGARFVLKYFT